MSDGFTDNLGWIITIGVLLAVLVCVVLIRRMDQWIRYDPTEDRKDDRHA